MSTGGNIINALELLKKDHTKVLKKLIEHHAGEEEEMFPLARKTMSESEFEELGEKMQARKKELIAG
ncbi:hypothetical protein [Halomonas sp. DQ26W]|uniref:hypothetical protein n=1 Tax=Halomonas sp. DQ26W TaxID=2282311 RepID=UPI0015F0490C|nr:hypothetical protein [Halomonas sp. DQ26W]